MLAELGGVAPGPLVGYPAAVMWNTRGRRQPGGTISPRRMSSSVFGVSRLVGHELPPLSLSDAMEAAGNGSSSAVEARRWVG